MFDFHHLLRTLVNRAKVLSKWWKSDIIKLLRPSGGMGVVTAFFFLIIGFISSNGQIDSVTCEQTQNFFVFLFLSFLKLRFDKHC